MGRKNCVLVYDGVYHVTSRIANRAMLLKPEEVKDRIAEWIRSVAAFSGVEVWAWCVMDNHLHLLVHVPPVPSRHWLDPGDEPAAYAFGMRPPECRVPLWSPGGGLSLCEAEIDFSDSRRKVNELFGKITRAMTRREFILSSSALAVCGCRTSGTPDALRAAMSRCIDAELYSVLAIGSNRIAPLVSGSRTLDGRLPVTAETLFDLASVGKTQTAALCALLVADGKLDSERDFVGVVLGGQIAGKAKTMDARVRLLQLMI